ncbi:MAG: DNA-binding response regulator [Bacteroidetes bacterium]|nr:DNA-binding response regulator [Bacteroidota bacterium]
MNHFEVELADNGSLAVTRAISGNFDAIVMDVNIPLINGFDATKMLREQEIKTPVLLLTALGTISDKVHGFDVGADDYLVKPFEFEELLARIKSLIKRARVEPLLDKVLKVADLEMNVDAKIVKRAGQQISLTAKEFMLLEYMLRNKGKVLSRSDIAEKIWDINFDTGTNVIDLYIFYLRKKIDKNYSKKLIHTQVGMGYVLKEE